MTAEPLVEATAAHVRGAMLGDASHDWWHVHRVWQAARTIAAGERAAGRSVDSTVVELGALLHDIADWKFHDGDDEAGPRAARAWLESQGAEATLVEAVTDIVRRVSFKGAGVPDDMPSLEGRIVQDADRLDAIGAVGIARAFAYGGHKGRPIHTPGEAAVLHASPEAYKAEADGNGASTTHFHEKLMLLRDRMHTEAGRRLADGRHAFMVTYLARFDAEWSGRA
ncbi:MAG: Metal-dependent phosphohydrolase, subdomain [Thermoleophilia bacterium]|nr:Metal-dependent phosphohydrolase, subdomain [Thermoleophilia bacterium]